MRSLLGLFAVVVLGCGPTVDPGGEDTEGGGAVFDGEARPYRDDWRTVIDQPFHTYASDGTLSIASVHVGGTSLDNFTNRGDVIVQYADADRIVVEMRRFTMAESPELAERDFSKTEVWAATAPFPAIPYELDPAADCVDPEGFTPWRDGCTISVFYDGQRQPERLGADLRVTLPRTFVHELVVHTDDNDADADYQNRGNVCIEGLPGSASIELGSGSAWVLMAEDASETPTCPTGLRTECQQAGWASSCPCIAQNHAFGGVHVTSHGGEATDATVDIPSGGFWVAHHIRNDGSIAPGDPALGAACEATVDPSAGEVTLNDGIDPVFAPYVSQGMVNYPGAPATPGAGYDVQLVSDACAAVTFTEHPDDFLGRGNGAQQGVAERGNLRVCSGCVRDMGCAGLIPD